MTNLAKAAIAGLIVVVVGGVGLWMYSNSQQGEIQQNVNINPTPTPSPNPTPTQTPTPSPNPTPTPSYNVPTLALSPATQEVTVGTKFDVQIILDTAGKEIDGIDIYKLHYDPKLLSLTVTPGTLMTLNAFNKVENGTFTFSQLAQFGTKYKGSGVLATLHFTALKAGTASVTMDFTAGAANKSNIAAGGKNILQQVVNGKYTIK
jgi:hypothetical protein